VYVCVLCICVCVYGFSLRRSLSIDQATTIIAIGGGDRCSPNDSDLNLVYNCSLLLLCYCFCQFSPLAVEISGCSVLNCKAVWWSRRLRIITIFRVYLIWTCVMSVVCPTLLNLVGSRVIRGPSWKWNKQVILN